MGNRKGNATCDRKVFADKYERNSSQIRDWWYELFRILETDASIPAHKQMIILNQVFPKRILARILSILSIQSKKFQEQVNALEIKDGGDARDDDWFEISARRISTKSIRDEAEYHEVARELDAKSKSDTIEKVFTQPQVPKSKMYADFFRRKPNRAAVWRSLPPLSLDEMSLNQKAETITEKIATDFIEWLKNLGGDEALSLTVESVIRLFEIGFHGDAVTSVKVGVRELASVPEKVAESTGMPHMGQRAVLHAEIARDSRAYKKRPTQVAFGSALPPNMQTRPPAESYHKRWTTCENVPERLASMAAVWQGITHLKSTRAFCEFLLEKPEVKPPKYLLEAGMIHRYDDGMSETSEHEPY
ncbi:uncharacterized protein LOC132696429 [Cylas formicarius]|uniref:uncharacterized protein LOC132696429 n=1 Tax=Cylas formicarius TaxID=197179 RepID=UPI002958B700|nr:uncharacterized protein LOC132696429 [Cylas formicarius]